MNTTSRFTPKFEGLFASFQQWVNKASSRLTDGAICVDAKGRICRQGRDFARARDENTFPVRFFYEMTAAPESGPKIVDVAPESHPQDKPLESSPPNSPWISVNDSAPRTPACGTNASEDVIGAVLDCSGNVIRWERVCLCADRITWARDGSALKYWTPTHWASLPARVLDGPSSKDYADTIAAICHSVGYTNEYAHRWPQERMSVTFLRFLEEHGFRA